MVPPWRKALHLRSWQWFPREPRRSRLGFFSSHSTLSMLTLSYLSSLHKEGSTLLRGNKEKRDNCHWSKQIHKGYHIRKMTLHSWGFIPCNNDHQGERYGNTDTQRHWSYFHWYQASKRQDPRRLHKKFQKWKLHPVLCLQLQDHHPCNSLQPHLTTLPYPFPDPPLSQLDQILSFLNYYLIYLQMTCLVKIEFSLLV